VRTRYAVALGITVAGLAVAVLVPGAAASGPSSSAAARDLASARAATAPDHQLAVAGHAGYSLLRDAAGIACIDEPTMGAMGVHYVDFPAVGNPAIDADHPEALVYEPTKNGRMQLVALEYVVLQADWDAAHADTIPAGAAHADPPSLFGQEFMLTPDPNRFGLPAFYSLHAWIWKHNPAGTFAMWNPDVSCAAA
jgi:hypothetical protein